jgi:hypothetical protein
MPPARKSLATWAREQAAKRGDFHRGETDVAQRHRQQSDAYPQLLSPSQSSCRRSNPAFLEAVLPQPELCEG